MLSDLIFTKLFIRSVKVIHVFSWASWMVGMFYLPRLFVYHTKVQSESEADLLLRTMERRLYYYIMTPAMVFTLMTGAFLTYSDEAWVKIWWYGKVSLVACMLMMHVLIGHHRKVFAYGSPRRTHVFYRVMNEVPTVLLLLILIMVIIKPYRHLVLFQ